VLDPKKEKSWKEISLANGTDLLKGVTQLAVNAKGDKLVVAE
jgi:hypothetical protein